MHNEYVIKGNSALFKCTIPSYVADFVSVQAWVEDGGNAIYAQSNDAYGNDLTSLCVLVIVTSSACSLSDIFLLLFIHWFDFTF